MGRSNSRSRSRGAGRNQGGDERGGRTRGIVITWHDEKGFGFIKPDRGGDDIFAHASGLKDGDALKEGSEVTFEENYDDKRGKYRAEQVQGCVYRSELRRGGYGGGGRGRDDSRGRGRGGGRDRSRGRRYDSRSRGGGRY